MAVPSSGSITLVGIFSEKNEDDYTANNPEENNISLRGLSSNSYNDSAGGNINLNSSSSSNPPNQTAPFAMSEFYGYDHDFVAAPTFINSTSNNNPESDNVVISITAPTGSNAFIGVAQDTSTTNISLSGSPTNINPSNLTGGTRKAQGFYKASPGTTAIGFQATRHSIVGMGFANVTSLAQNVSSATTSTGTVSVTRTTATNKTFIGLAASHASSDNDSIPNFSGYTAERKTGNNEELRGGAGVAYKHGTGSSVTYTHVYGGADGLATEYGFHELVR
jgi:hypothetical protein